MGVACARALRVASLVAVGAVAAADQFGTAICALGDVNGDGRVDFAISDPTHPSASGSASPSKVAIVCGRSRSAIAVLTAVDSGERLGCVLAPVPDLDGDHFNDLAVLVEARNVGEAESRGTSRARIEFVSTRDGRQLGTWALPAHARNAQDPVPLPAIVACPDIDGDGRADIAVGCPWSELESGRDGSIRLVSSRTLQLVRIIEGPTAPCGFAASLACDVGDDGSRWLFVGSRSSIDLYGADGLALLRRLPARFGGGSWDSDVLLGPDFDGDGLRELLAVASLGTPGQSARSERTLVMFCFANGLEIARGSIPAGQTLCFLGSTRDGVPCRIVAGFQAPTYAQCGITITSFAEGAKPIRLDFESILASSASAELLERYRASHVEDFEMARRPWGQALTSLGDVNGDGIDDFLAGGASVRSDLEHVAWLLSGADGSVLDLFWRLDPRLRLRD